MELADDHLAAGAGADHEDLVSCGDVAVARALDDQPQRASRAPVISSRVSMKSITATERGSPSSNGWIDGEEDDEDRAGGGDRADDHQEVAAAHVAPPLLVEAEGGEDRELADHDEGDGLDE